MPTLFSQLLRSRAVATFFAALFLFQSLPRPARADVEPPPAASPNVPSSSATPTGLGMPDSGGAASVGDLASVDPSTGDLHMSYPFALPPARGSGPSLAISYSSSQGDAEAGFGWGMNLPSILRKSAADTASPAYDDVAASGGTYQQIGTDHFYYSGQSLVPICMIGGPSGSSCQISPATLSLDSDVAYERLVGWYYFRAQVERGPSTAFLWSPDHASWLVLANGTWMELGVPYDVPATFAGNVGLVPDTLRDGRVVLYKWNIVAMHDAHLTAAGAPANPVLYIWDGASLTDIYDTPLLTTDALSLDAFAHHTRLVYDAFFAPRVTIRPWHARPTKRLARVDVTSQDMGGGQRSLLRQYTLKYELEAGHWNHDHLMSIDAHGRCANSSANSLDPATIFEGSDGHLPEGIPPCSSYPTTSFTYSKVPALSTTVHTMTGIPPQAGVPVGRCSTPGSPPWSDCNLPGACPAGSTPDLAHCSNPPDNSTPYPICTCYVTGAQHAASLDINGDGLPDLIEPGLPTATGTPGPSTLCINKGNDRLDCSGTISAPDTFNDGLQDHSILEGGGRFVYGDFLGNGGINRIWIGAPPTGSAEDLEPVEQAYAIFSPVAIAGTPNYQWTVGTVGRWKWTPKSASTANVGRSLLQDRVDSTVDLDGDGLTDLLTFRQTFETATVQNPLPPPAHGVSGAALTKRAASGAITPFNRVNEPGVVPTYAQDLTAVYRDSVPLWSQLASSVVQTEVDREHANKKPMRSAAFEYADMNGDGLVDLVAPSPARYWPGFGDGTFGNVTCTPMTVVQDGSPITVPTCKDAPSNDPITMLFAPGLDPAEAQMTFHDVTGDGYADLIVSTADVVDVYVNQLGTTFTAGVKPDLHFDTFQLGRLWAFDPSLSFADSTVMFADLNGSGGDDLVLAGGDIGYVDPTGGIKPGLLTGVTNTDGIATTIAYEATARLDIGGTVPWQKHSAQSMHVVTSIETNNGLAAPHRISNTTSYTYLNPEFEPRSHQFRGFDTVLTYHPGDDLWPGTNIITNFLIGVCPHAAGASCPPLVDSPFDAVRGLVASSTTTDGSGGGVFQGKTLSTSHSTYQVRKVAQGSDGRSVRLVYPEQSDTFVYDTNGSTVQGTVALTDIHAIDAGDQVFTTQTSVPTDGSPGIVHLKSSGTLDDWGRATKGVDYGQSGVDDAIVTTSDWYTPPGAVLGLVSRVHTTNTGKMDAMGALVDAGRAKTSDYSAAGDLTDVTATLSGMEPLTRTVPAPASASTGGAVKLVHIDRDPVYGTALQTTRPNDRLETNGYDGFHQFVTSKSVRTGTALTGYGTLTTSTSFDRGLGKVISVWDASGATTTTTYDGIGRVLKVTKPSAAVLGMTNDSVTIEYLTASNGVRATHTTVVVDYGPTVKEAWSYIDAFGQSLGTASSASVADGDGSAWLVSGVTDRSATGRVARSYVPTFGAGSLPSSPTGHPFAAFTYDAQGRVLTTTGLDGTLLSRTVYHPLSVESFDAEDLLPTSPHANTPTLTTMDGHGRKVRTFEQSLNPSSSVTTSYTYLPTGEVSQLTRVYDQGPYATKAGQGTYVRNLYYDTFGRLVRNQEPNTQYASDAHKVWRYAYDDAGDTVATDDASDCGENIFYDAAGRKLAEDYVPCQPWHAPYTAPNLVTGDGTEAFYRYDTGEADQVPYNSAASWLGRLVSIQDRAAHTRFNFDARGRTVGVARQLAKPGVADASLAARYSPYWFQRGMGYDEADRVKNTSTGVDVDELRPNGASTVTTEYGTRGLLKHITSDYGPLLTNLTYDADGSPLTRTRGDAALTTTTLQYTFAGVKRLQTATVARGQAPSAWSTPPSGYTAPTDATDLILSNVSYAYDRVGNPLSITDSAPPGSWPAGAKPVSRTMQYDDLYRLTKVSYDSGGDTFVDPMPASAVATIASPKRVQWQTFEYDGSGNTIKTSDDASVFFGRSLGKITNGITSVAGDSVVVPNQLSMLGDRALRANGVGGTTYDKAGNLWTFSGGRPGATCMSGRVCTASFIYEWDEVNRLAHAIRRDAGVRALAADLTYAYDANGDRVLTANAITGTYNATIFPSLRLQAATWDPSSSTYERDAKTETAYLPGGARVVYSENDVPSLASGKLHVFFTLGDGLGSTSMVIDRDTSEVVERRSYQPYGAVESDYRPERWKGFREPFGFTGKEEDLEVGLTYFGARYYSPILGRWASPDPLTIHKLGGDLNPYAYVGGHVYAAIDPDGLEEKAPVSQQPVCSGSGDGCTNTSSSGGDSSTPPVDDGGPIQSVCDAKCVQAAAFWREYKGPTIDVLPVETVAVSGGVNIVNYHLVPRQTLGELSGIQGLPPVDHTEMIFAPAMVIAETLEPEVKEAEALISVAAKSLGAAEGGGAGVTRLFRAVEGEELKDVVRFGDYNIHPNSTFKRFAFGEGDLDAFIQANPGRSYTKTFVDIPTSKLQFMFEHPDPGGVGRAVGIDVFEHPEFYDWFKGPVQIIH